MRPCYQAAMDRHNAGITTKAQFHAECAQILRDNPLPRSVRKPRKALDESRSQKEINYQNAVQTEQFWSDLLAKC